MFIAQVFQPTSEYFISLEKRYIMKKIIFAFAFLMTGSLVQAQIDQGTKRLGGNFIYNVQNNEPSGLSSSNYNLGPQLGYFLADGLEAIAGFGFTGSKSDNGGGFETKSNGFALNIGIRKYKMIEDNFGIYGGVGFGISSNKTENINPGPPVLTTTTENSGMNSGLNAGLTFWPTEHWGLTAGFGVLNYSTTKTKGTSVESSNLRFGLMNGMSFSLSYYFE